MADAVDYTLQPDGPDNAGCPLRSAVAGPTGGKPWGFGMNSAMKQVTCTLRDTALAILAVDDARKAGGDLDSLMADLVLTARKAVNVAEHADTMLDRAHAATAKADAPKREAMH